MRNFILLIAGLMVSSATLAADPEPLKILFLGDNGHHRPAERFAQLAPRLAKRGIQLVYSDRMQDLHPDTLGKYDGLIVYANQDTIEPDQERALLDYVNSGRGFIPLHCASYCFRNSDAYVALVGGQFQRHGGEVFGTEIDRPDHPVMQGFGGFRSWDETYIHTLENEDRTILEYRRQGDQAPTREREPYTWVRNAGQGRVFYTAWGHDERTFGNPGFVNLVERGIRWACGGDPKLAGDFVQREPFVMPSMTALSKDVAPFEYTDVGNEIPNYLAGDRWGEQGKPLSTMQLPLSPQESLKHYVTPQDFGLELFAAEDKMGAKPIAMSWDERGRLWVCLTIDYPNELRDANAGNDRVMICEDTNGDNLADKFTLFADKLSIPTAIVHYRGGVIVQDGVRTLFLKDTNGDDVADVRHTLITGWELGDTHGGVSNFRYGLDNWIWGMQGYNNSRPQFHGGQSGPFRMGFFRFKLDNSNPPNVTDVEFIRSTNNNTWGLGISEEGLIFGSTANRNPSVFMPIANRYYERVRGWGPEQLGSIADTHLFAPITDKVRQVDQFGGYTAGAGHSLYTARVYPQSWWNRTAFVNGPTGHLTGIFVLEPNGAGFTSTSPGNLVASDDEWAAPIQAEVGPDGNVWVIDWYNYIIQHNPTPQGFQTGKGNAYESVLRDKKHGRILRVTYGDKDAAASAWQALDSQEPAQWLAALSHSNMLWRLHAQRLLVERGETDCVDELVEMINDPSVDAIGLNAGVIHSLWTLHGLGAIRNTTDVVGRQVVACLKHRSPGVRRTALQVLPVTTDAAASILAHGCLQDDDAQVRLAAILAIADLPLAPGTGDAIAALANDSGVTSDPWLSDAVTSAAAVHASDFLASVLVQEAAPSTALLSVMSRVAQHVARGRPEKGIDQILIAMSKAPVAKVSPVLEGLLNGWPTGFQTKITKPTEEALLALADSLPPAELSQLVSLADRLGTVAFEAYADRVAQSLRTVLVDTDKSDEARMDAAKQLVALLPNRDGVVEDILATIDLQMAPDMATAIVQTLSASRSAKVAPSLVELLGGWTPTLRQSAIRLLLSRPEWTVELIAGLEAGTVNLSDLALDQRQALASHPNAEIRDAAKKMMAAGGGLPSPNRVAVIEKYSEATHNKGDSNRGRELFKEHCSKCHKHGDMGVEIGPELTGMAVHPKEELLIHVLDPSRSVEGNFRSYVVLTAEGRVLTGMLASESKTTIELIDTNAKRETVSRSDIEELNASTKSVMPEGFEDQLNIKAMTDLLEFLTTRGKYLPVDLRKIATLPTDRPMFYGAEGEVMMFEDWGPKQVDGVPFMLVKPDAGKVGNGIMLYGPTGKIPPTLPKQVEIPVGGPVGAIHMLGGVGGWSAQNARANGPAVMTVRVIYADGKEEDHILRDGVHFADYIGPFEVPESKQAFRLRNGFQIRYLKVTPARPTETVVKLELIKNQHNSSPITMAITLESPVKL
jgi:putative membrane-bound dehydrogenase-like protein